MNAHKIIYKPNQSRRLYGTKAAALGFAVIAASCTDLQFSEVETGAETTPELSSEETTAWWKLETAPKANLYVERETIVSPTRYEVSYDQSTKHEPLRPPLLNTPSVLEQLTNAEPTVDPLPQLSKNTESSVPLLPRANQQIKPKRLTPRTAVTRQTTPAESQTSKTSRPPQTLADEPKNAAVAIPPSLDVWAVSKGQTAKTTLQEWAKTAEWQLAWKANVDYRIGASAVFDGNFKQATTRLLSAFKHERKPLNGKFYQNRVLVIENQ